MNASSECTVLVTSCDAYHDIEAPFLAMWRKYWPDCPFRLVLLTETLPTPGFDETICTGRGKKWCQMLAEALEQIGTPYVLMLMNDYFLSSPVDTGRFMQRLREAKRFGAASLRLMPNPPGKHPWEGSDLMEMPKNTAYCVTCQATIWERGFLLSLARRNRSAWEFERYGSFMMKDEARPLLVTREKEFPFLDCVHKGYWEKWGLELLAREGVPYSGSRTLPPANVRLAEWAKAAIFRLLPWNLIVRTQNIFNAGKK